MLEQSIEVHHLFEPKDPFPDRWMFVALGKKLRPWAV